MNANASILRLLDNCLNCGHKKTGPWPGFLFIDALCLSTCGIGQRIIHRLCAVQFAERVAYHLLGEAGALAALGAHAGAFANFAIVAGAIVDRIADVGIGNTLAEADVHGRILLEVLS
ncbi:hypothetical protein D9M71_597280 [compost metagenome]